MSELAQVVDEVVSSSVEDSTRREKISGKILGEGRVLEQAFNKRENISIEIISDGRKFKLLQNDWNKLACAVKFPFVQYEWFDSCVNALCSESALYVVVLRFGGEILAIAPLVMKGRILKRLEMLGSAVLCEPVGFLYRDKESVGVLIDILLSQQLPLLPGRMPAGSAEDNYLQEKSGYSFLRFSKSIPAPWIPIHTSWQEFERRISSSRRSAMRRAERKANELGTVTTEILSPTAGEAQNLLEEIIEIENSGWKQKNRTSMAENSELKRFFIHYANAMALKGALRMCFLRINGKAVAAQIAVEYADSFWVLKVGYNVKFASCSPGILLMHHTIRCAFEKNLKTFEFMGSDEPWIRIWTNAMRGYRFYRIYPITMNGVSFFLQHGISMILKKFQNRLMKKHNDRKN